MSTLRRDRISVRVLPRLLKPAASVISDAISDRLATQPEAEVGVVEAKLMSPLRTRQGVRVGLREWFRDPGTRYHTDYGPVEQFHFGGRAFMGSIAGHQAGFATTGTDPALSFQHRILHNWATRDSQLAVSSQIGGMAIVGLSQASYLSRLGGWPAAPNFGPAAIGVSGFSINDQVPPLPGGAGWGGYFDAVRFPNASFTVGLEAAVANLGDNVILQPFNVKTTGGSTVAAWLQSGCGLDAVDYTNPSNPNQNAFGPVGNISAYIVTLSSFVDNAAKAWSGIIISDGSIVDRSAGSDVYEAMAMPPRHQLAWYRSDGTQAAFLWCSDASGSGATGINIGNQRVTITGNDGIWASKHHVDAQAFFSSFSGDPFINFDTNDHLIFLRGSNEYAFAIGGATRLVVRENDVEVAGVDGVRAPFFRTGAASFWGTAGSPARPTLQFAANNHIDFNAPSNEMRFKVNDVNIVQLNPFALNTTGVYAVNNVRVIAARKTGWSLPTGTLTRATFNTGSVTLPQLAERVAALIADLHDNGGLGHGLIGD